MNVVDLVLPMSIYVLILSTLSQSVFEINKSPVFYSRVFGAMIMT